MLVALTLAVGGAAMAMFPPAPLRTLVGGKRPAPPAPAAPSAFDTSGAMRTASASGGLSDSASRLVTQAGSPLATDEPDQARRLTRGGLRLRRAAMQASHAGSDSAAVGAVPPTTSTAEADSREVMLHVNRARDFTRQTQLRDAGLELRTAYEEYRIFLTEHAGAPQTEMLRRELQLALDDALATCKAARDSTVARGGRAFRCQHPARTGILQDDEDSTATVPPSP